jgi:uncharacterized membrane protein
MPVFYLIIFINNINEFTYLDSKDGNKIIKDMKRYLKKNKEFQNFSNKLINKKS